jgi:hypothetical protein
LKLAQHIDSNNTKVEVGMDTIVELNQQDYWLWSDSLMKRRGYSTEDTNENPMWVGKRIARKTKESFFWGYCPEDGFVREVKWI